MRSEHEFFAVEDVEWVVVRTSPGVSERVLSRDDDEILTRLARCDAGLDTTPSGVITHAYVEEVLILTGELIDLTLGRRSGRARTPRDRRGCLTGRTARSPAA